MSAPGTVVLAFSGGLDTSYCLVRFREEGVKVITAIVDTGGMDAAELEAVERRATELGTERHVVIDGRARLYDEFITYLLKANYLRNGIYPSCVGVERMLQAEEVTKLALSVGADAIAHGSTGAGNDHVRFDAVISALAPELEILAPIRDHEITREQASEFLRARGIDAPEKTTRYSINQGLMGTSIGGGETYGSCGIPAGGGVAGDGVARRRAGRAARPRPHLRARPADRLRHGGRRRRLVRRRLRAAGRAERGRRAARRRPRRAHRADARGRRRAARASRPRGSSS